MADQTAIAAVSRSLRTLLRDRMAAPATITFAPPDVTVAGVDGARVNLYLMHVIESAELKNQEIPFAGYPGAYGRPPLSLNLRYLLTTYSATETQPDSDLNAQTLLGDAMRVLHEFGARMGALAITNPAAGLVGDPVLDPSLAGELERLRLVMQPVTVDELTRIWSAWSEANFRRSVLYEVTVVQIEPTERATRPAPVHQRVITAQLRRSPEIAAAYASSPPEPLPGQNRVRVGDEITIEAADVVADRLYVRLGGLDPIRVTALAGRVRIVVPDDIYPADLDHLAPRPIPTLARLQPGPLEVQLLAERATDGVQGGLDHGTSIQVPVRHGSNIGLLQLVPRVIAVTPAAGTKATLLQLTGTRLWRIGVRTAEVMVGDAVIRIRPPGPGDLFAAPTPVQVQVPMADASGVLPMLAPTDPPYPVGVQVDGARSRDAVTFRLGP